MGFPGGPSGKKPALKATVEREKERKEGGRVRGKGTQVLWVWIKVLFYFCLFEFIGCLQCGRPGFDSWIGKIPWRRQWQPTPVLLPGKSHGWRSLVGYSPWGCKQSDTTGRLHFHLYIHICVCEGVYICVCVFSLPLLYHS